MLVPDKAVGKLVVRKHLRLTEYSINSNISMDQLRHEDLGIEGEDSLHAEKVGVFG